MHQRPLFYYEIPLGENSPGLLQEIEDLAKSVGGRHVECVNGNVEIYAALKEDDVQDSRLVKEMDKKGWRYQLRSLPWR